MKHYLAIDLGATSGRTIIGTLDNGRVSMEELTRFDNPLIALSGHLYWDLYALYNEIIRGLQLAAQRGIDIQSIGIDTWGCDFALFGEDGALLRNPIAYRDPHTNGMMEKFFDEKMPKEEVYKRTGIQFMNFNSLFQLYALQQHGDSALLAAAKILFIPDALGYMLTGKAVCEYTVASTSQLLNPMTGDLDKDLLDRLGIHRDTFGPMAMPATILGTLTPEVQKLTGLGAIPVITVAGHDTASAVAAVPAHDKHFAYLSSGTWSLMGIETSKAIINKESLSRNFTNEGGVDGTTRFLKNICGMWIYECCRREWKDEILAEEHDAAHAKERIDRELAHQRLQDDAMQEPSRRSLVNPDDPAFAAPASMQQAIRDYCAAQGQPVPETRAQICRCIFDSLVERYKTIFGWLQDFAPFSIDTLHIIGGGSVNVYLNQMTADALGVRVLAGPQEGTALGNIMLQAKADGVVDSIWDIRRVIAQSVTPKEYLPKGSQQ
jgi:rhamnulokinase